MDTLIKKLSLIEVGLRELALFFEQEDVEKSKEEKFVLSVEGKEERKEGMEVLYFFEEKSAIVSAESKGV